MSIETTIEKKAARSSACETSERLVTEAQDEKQKEASNQSGRKTSEDQPIENGTRHYKDGSYAVIENGLCKSWTHPGAGTVYYEWSSDGQLQRIRNADQTSFRFTNGYWQHFDRNNKPDAAPNEGLRVVFQDGIAVVVKGPITLAVLNSLLERYSRNQSRDSDADMTEENSEQSDAVIKISTTEASDDTIGLAALALLHHKGDPDACAAAIRDLPPSQRGRLDEAFFKASGGKTKLCDMLQQSGFEDAWSAYNTRSEKPDLAWLEASTGYLSRGNAGIISEHTMRKTFSTMSKEDFASLTQEVATKYGRTLEDWMKERGASAETLQALDVYKKGVENLTADDFKKLAEIAVLALEKASAFEQNFDPFSRAIDRESAEKQRQKALLLFKECFGGDDSRVVAARLRFAGEGGLGRLEEGFGRGSLKLRQAADYLETGKLRTDTAVELASGSFFANPYGVELALGSMTEDERSLFRRGEEQARLGKNDDRQALDYYSRVHRAIEKSNDGLGDGIISTLRLEGHPSRRLNETLRLEDIARNGRETLLGKLAKSAGDRSAALNAIGSLSKEDYQLLKTDATYRHKVYQLIGGEFAYSGTTLFSFNDSIVLRRKLNSIDSAGHFNQALEGAGISLRETIQGIGFTQSNDAGVYAALSRSSPQEYKELDPLDKKKLDDRVNSMDSISRSNALRMLQDLKEGRTIQNSPLNDIDLLALRSKSPAEAANYLLRLRRTDPESFAKLVDNRDPLSRQRIARMFPGNLDIAQRFLTDGSITLSDLARLNKKNDSIDPVKAKYGIAGATTTGAMNALSFYRGLENLTPEEKKAVARMTDAEFARVCPGCTPLQRGVARAIADNPDGRPTLADEIRAQTIGDISPCDASLVERFASLSPEKKLQVEKEYTARYGSRLSPDWLASLEGSLKERAALALTNNTQDRRLVEAKTLDRETKGSYDASQVIDGGLRVREAEQKLASPSLSPGERAKIAELVEDSHARWGKQLQDNDEAKRRYAGEVSSKTIELAGYAAAPLLPQYTSLRPLLYAAMAGALTKASIEHDIRGDLGTSDERLSLFALGAIEGTINFGDATVLSRAFSGTAMRATRESAEILSRQAGREVLSLEVQEQMSTRLASLMERKVRSGETEVSQQEVEAILASTVRLPAPREGFLRQAAAEVREALRRAMPESVRDILQGATRLKVARDAERTIGQSASNQFLRETENNFGRRILLQGRELNLADDAEIIIGRQDTSVRGDVVDRLVSSQHARLKYDSHSGQMILTDQSTNGTFVRRNGENGWTVVKDRAVRLNPGDEVRLGSQHGPEVKLLRLKGELDRAGAVRFTKQEGNEWVSPSGTRIFNDRAGVTTVTDRGGRIQQVETASAEMHRFYYSHEGRLERIDFEEGGSLVRVEDSRWQLTERGGGKSEFRGDVNSLPDGSIEIIDNHRFFNEVRRPDRSIEYHLPNGRVNYVEADCTVERQRLKQFSSAKFNPPERAARFQELMRSFEERAQERGLPEQEIAQTYHQLNRLINADAGSVLSQEKRLRLAEEAMNNAIHPHLISQGANNTCNVTGIEKRLYERQPSEALRVVADAATTGKYFDVTGTQVDLTRLPQGLKPDAEATKIAAQGFDRNGADLRRDGARNYASQLFQYTAVNVHYAHSPAFRTNSDDIVMYFKGEPSAGNFTGEQLVRFGADAQNKLASDLRGQNPVLGANEIAEINTLITGSSRSDYFLINRLSFSPPGARAVDSVQDMENALLLLKGKNQLPAVAAVHTSHEPFRTAANGASGWHLVTVGDIFMGADGHYYVNVYSNWSSNGNFVGKNAMRVEQLYKATMK